MQVVSKQLVMGGHSYVMLSGLMDSHLLYPSIPHTSWKISYIFCTLFTSILCQALKEQTCNHIYVCITVFSYEVDTT